MPAGNKGTISLSDLIHQGKLKQGEEVIAVLPGRPRIVVDKGVIGTPQQGILYNHKGFSQPLKFLKEAYRVKGQESRKPNGWRHVLYRGISLFSYAEKLNSELLECTIVEEMGDQVLVEFLECKNRQWMPKSKIEMTEAASPHEEEDSHDSPANEPLASNVRNAIVPFQENLALTVRNVRKKEAPMQLVEYATTPQKQVNALNLDMFKAVRKSLETTKAKLAEEERKIAMARQYSQRLQAEISSYEKTVEEYKGAAIERLKAIQDEQAALQQLFQN